MIHTISPHFAVKSFDSHDFTANCKSTAAENMNRIDLACAVTRAQQAVDRRAAMDSRAAMDQQALMNHKANMDRQASACPAVMKVGRKAFVHEPAVNPEAAVSPEAAVNPEAAGNPEAAVKHEAAINSMPADVDRNMTFDHAVRTPSALERHMMIDHEVSHEVRHEVRCEAAPDRTDIAADFDSGLPLFLRLNRPPRPVWPPRGHHPGPLQRLRVAKREASRAAS